MIRHTRTAGIVRAVLVAVFTAAVIGCGSAHDGDDPDRDTLPLGALVDDIPIVVPTGMPDELFAFMERIQHDELSIFDDPENFTAEGTEARNKAIVRVMHARIEACDKILDADASDDLRVKAIRNRLDALRTLVPLEVERSTEFAAYARQLIEGDEPQLRQLALATQFQADVGQYLSQRDRTSEQLLSRLETLLAEPSASADLMWASQDAAKWLIQAGDEDAAAAIYRSLGRRFQQHSDQELAAEASRILTHATNIEFTKLVRAVKDDRPGALEHLMAQLRERLGPTNEDSTALEFAMQTAQYLELTGRYDQAGVAYELIRRRFQHDELLAEVVDASVDLANRRLGLIGEPLDIDGVLINEQPLDWETFRGQWVLVAFWTTWHPDWLNEYENMRSAVARRESIDVVLVNLDDDRNLVERFLKEHPTSWTMVFDPDPYVPGLESANAVRCGVETVPFTMLLDPDGRVVDIHLTGDRLPTILQQHLGPRSLH